MAKKLTIRVSDEFYDGLQRRVGKRGIGRFLEELARPHVNLRHVFPWEARVELRGRASKVLADQIRTLAKERLATKLGVLSAPELDEVERAIRVQLDLR